MVKIIWKVYGGFEAADTAKEDEGRRGWTKKYSTVWKQVVGI